MTRLSAHQLEIDLPTGWDGAIFRKTPGPGETSFPVMHVANFALPPDRGDYGAGAVELMGPGNVFIALVEHGPRAVPTALFANSGFELPLTAPKFNPTGLQRIIRGQAGYQRFFNLAGRAFCVYVVIGSIANAAKLASAATGALSSVVIGEASG